jgi:D-arabinose 5-phosphate isomerase GutQ
MPTMAVNAGKVPVSERALVQRIRRKLAKDGRELRALRGNQSDGRWVVVTGNGRRAHVMGSGFQSSADLMQLGRELGVVHPWEALAP